MIFEDMLQNVIFISPRFIQVDLRQGWVKISFEKEIAVNMPKDFSVGRTAGA